MLVQDLLEILAGFEVDYTIFFRLLCDYRIGGNNSRIYSLFKKSGPFMEWEKRYVIRLKQEGWPDLHRGNSTDEARSRSMKKHNPKYILRNYMAETAIRNATFAKDYSEVKKLIRLFRNPYDEMEGFDSYASFSPEWARSISVSCSS
jgi:uncharacterized protein YdiU (UPF0061 family)